MPAAPPTSSTAPSIFAPPKALIEAQRGLTHARHAALLEAARLQGADFWLPLAQAHLRWDVVPAQGLDASRAPHYGFFTDGRLNVSVQCLDRHLPHAADKLALICERETGEVEQFTYRQLHRAVCQFANGLLALGVGLGDRVVLMLPHTAEAIIAMQACARIGAVHSVVFGGFSADALQSRIEDAAAKVVITADGSVRGGKYIDLKHIADEALKHGCASVERVVVFERHPQRSCPMQPGRDVAWSQLKREVSDDCAPASVPSEHPLFLLYTSGSTGRPKGIVHSSAGYMLGAMTSLLWAFELTPDDVYWCTADVGWITGHTYVAYGPLAIGCTQIIYEGAPTQPDAGRLWQMCARYNVSIFYTSPTAIRALKRLGDTFVTASSRRALRVLGSVGEPINPEAWRWFYDVVGESRCPIIDSWWQTETGSIMMAPVPAVTPTKPGSCTMPLPGVQADIVDEHGERVTKPHTTGVLVIRAPWPSMARTIYNDDARYVQTYWARYNNRFYVAGDGAFRDEDGYFWITGRIDDVLNVSGHRLGTAEIESALCTHPCVAEAAVVGVADAIKGESIFAYVVLRKPAAGAAALTDAALYRDLRAWVAERIGALAKPDALLRCDALPKTRSGKIMRRLLRSLARGEPITEDVSTLEDPQILHQLQHQTPLRG